MRFPLLAAGAARVTAVGFVLLFGSACATLGLGDDDADEDAPSGINIGALRQGELPTAVRFQKTAEGNWKRGNAAFEDSEYIAAQQYYQYIRTKFPYSRFASLAEVRVADCQYEREQFLAAIDTYETFVRTHPNHKQVPYAMYRIGLGYYEQIPTDFFILPPAHEKDQTAVKDAARKLAEYVRRFPDHEKFAVASEKLSEVRSQLMDHERYVADFYRHQERMRGYVLRLEVIRKEFADVGLNDELLYEIAEAWAEIGEFEKSEDAIAQLTKSYPKSELVAEAQTMLTEAKETKAREEAEAAAKAKEEAEEKTSEEAEETAEEEAASES